MGMQSPGEYGVEFATLEHLLTRFYLFAYSKSQARIGLLN